MCVCVRAVVGCADTLTAGASAMTLRGHRLTATVRCLQTRLIHHAVCIDHRSRANIANTCTAAAAAASRKWRLSRSLSSLSAVLGIH